MTKTITVYHDKAKLAKMFAPKEEKPKATEPELPAHRLAEIYRENLEAKLRIATNALKSMLNAKGATRDKLLLMAQEAVTNVSTYDERRNVRK